jgi:hypothetical protein
MSQIRRIDADYFWKLSVGIRPIRVDPRSIPHQWVEKARMARLL